MSNSIVDYVFRALGLEYLNRTDLVQVPPKTLLRFILSFCNQVTETLEPIQEIEPAQKNETLEPVQEAEPIELIEKTEVEEPIQDTQPSNSVQTNESVIEKQEISICNES